MILEGNLVNPIHMDRNCNSYLSEIFGIYILGVNELSWNESSLKTYFLNKYLQHECFSSHDT